MMKVFSRSEVCKRSLLATALALLMLVCNQVFFEGTLHIRAVSQQTVHRWGNHVASSNAFSADSKKYCENHSMVKISCDKRGSYVIQSNQSTMKQSAQLWRANNNTVPVENIFYKVDVCEEKEFAIEGGPLDYLPSYESPCWEARYPLMGHLYSRSWLRQYMLSNGVREFLMRAKKEAPLVRIRCLPAIYLIGAPGSGTTDLFEMLTKYSGRRIIAAAVKEPVYWSHGRSAHSFSDYLDLFDPVGYELHKRPLTNGTHLGLTIDSSTFNMFRNDLWREQPSNAGAAEPRYTLAHTLKSLYSSAKILVILRQPSLRLLSQYRANHGTGRSVQRFDEDVRKVIPQWQRCIDEKGVRGCVYDFYNNLRKVELETLVIPRASLYYPLVRDWMEVFGQCQMKVVRAEDYYDDRVAVLKDIFEFLGIDTTAIDFSPLAEETVKHKHKAVPMLPSTKHYLDDFFRPYNQQLSAYLGSPKFLWNDRT